PEAGLPEPDETAAGRCRDRRADRAAGHETTAGVPADPGRPARTRPPGGASAIRRALKAFSTLPCYGSGVMGRGRAGGEPGVVIGEPPVKAQGSRGQIARELFRADLIVIPRMRPHPVA